MSSRSHVGWLTLLVAVAVTGSAFGQQQVPDLTRYGFTAEPGVAVGTPCGLNVVARFWYGYVGVAASGIYLPPSVSFMNGNGFETALCLRLNKSAKAVSPQFGVGYGQSNIVGTVSGKSYGLTTKYVGAFGGVSYLGAFAQVGLGIGTLQLGSDTRLPIVPLVKVGWAKAIGGSSK